MKPITFDEYRTDPLIREQLEREVRRARSRAIARFLVMPFRALLHRPCRKTAGGLAVRGA